MVTIQKLTSLSGKVLEDRQGNTYQLVSIMLDGEGRPDRIVVSNKDGMRSQRFPNGRVKASGLSLKDILLPDGIRPRNVNVGPFYDGLDEEDYALDNPLEDDNVFITRPTKSRARYGQFVTPDTDFVLDDNTNISNIVRGPNSSKSNSDIKITITMKGQK